MYSISVIGVVYSSFCSFL